MSCQPSPSASSTTTPDPIVSGRYFLPNAPLLWTKRMPAACVMSVNCTGVAALNLPATIKATKKRQHETQRGTVFRGFVVSWLDIGGRLVRTRGRAAVTGRRVSPGDLCETGPRRCGPMLVNLLPLVVIVGRLQAVRAGDRLRRLVGLEALVQLLLPLGELGVAQPLVTEHQVVMRLQVLRIDQQRPLERGDRLVELPLEELHAAD